MVETLIIGLSIGSILFLGALGLAIIYGTMRVINMAHGEMVMIGAYSTVLVTTHLGLSLYWCIPVAFLTTALMGYALELFVVRHLYGRLLDTLLATWGVALILQQAIRVHFGLQFFGIEVAGLGPGLQNVPVPTLLQSTIELGTINVPAYRTFLLLIAIALGVLTWWIIYRTSLGRQLRAVTRNRAISACCGIDDKRINSLTFAYGSGLAGVAGVMVSGFKTVSPDMGTSYVIESFLVVVAGGVGSLLGTAATAGLLGELQSIVANLFNDVYGRTMVFLAVIIIILYRPQGLFTFRSR